MALSVVVLLQLGCENSGCPAQDPHIEAGVTLARPLPSLQLPLCEKGMLVTLGILRGLGILYIGISHVYSLLRENPNPG